MSDLSGLPVGDTRERGRGATRKPDIVRLLAVLAARQRSLPTARAMRAGATSGDVCGAAERMVHLFGAVGPAARLLVFGAFNGGTARFLTEDKQGENGVYRGA